MKQALNKLGIEVTSFNIKDFYEKSLANIILNCEKQTIKKSV